ncbi:MAG: anaerobic ribonucleoside-triphosphate reductase, partial [Bacteroidales bacterium]|nr:anaerobic ribonucleoside-triphosphate reductase [Bacteroidales bacterium]
MIADIYIIKRNGKREPFSVDKIRNAISKAFISVGGFASQEAMTNILSRLNIYDGIAVEEIQNQVERSLMAERYYEVAKAYILYRQKHYEDREVKDKMEFLINYCNARNAATGSKYDANANVERKNIATLIGELPKSSFIRLNRRMLCDRIKDVYGKELADKYLYYLNNHFIYKNDETSIANYCASVTMYPWLLNGTQSIGGNASRPTNLKSFCGGFVNMVFMVSSMLSGACATPEFLMYMNYFIELEYGPDYYKEADKVVDLSLKQRTIDKVITDCFEQVVYTINQPSGARNFQSVFWNIAYYDKFYFKSLFANFRFPDGSEPHWDSLNWLQKRFMRWFNKERTRAVLTFPVETMALLSKDGDVLDKEYGDFTAEMYAEGHSFFTYLSDNADSLSSCCRLRNEIQDNGFSYTLGAGGVSTGSKSVLTINLNRCIQYAHRNNIPYLEFLEEMVDLTHKVQICYNENLKYLLEKGMLPLFDAGYIAMSRQYLTIG